MKPELKKLISEHLRDSILNEDLSNREAADKIGIKSPYISMVFNQKLWDSCPASAWEKLEAWHMSRLNIKDFMFTGPYVEMPIAPVSEQEKQPETAPEEKNPVKTSKPKVKQKRKTDPDKIQQEAFSKYSSTEAPFLVIPAVATPDVQFTDTARLKVALDIEINLVVNGQKVMVS